MDYRGPDVAKKLLKKWQKKLKLYLRNEQLNPKTVDEPKEATRHICKRKCL